MKVFDEPLGESKTVFLRKAPNNIFIVKLKNSTPGVKILEFESNRKLKISKKVKIHTN